MMREGGIAGGCPGTAVGGAPRHPLYPRGDAQLTVPGGAS